MTKYYDVLIDGEFDQGFINSKKDEAITYFNGKAQDTTKDVKLVLRWRKVIKHSKQKTSKVYLLDQLKQNQEK